jgi:putative aldouronate transport system permease protein
MKNVFINLKKHRLLYLMFLPPLIYFIVFQYYPMYGLILSFKDFNLFKGIIHSPWAGLKHYEALFTGPYFFRIFRNTLMISSLKLFVGYPAAVILALMIFEVRITWLKKTVQTFSYLPHFFSWVVIYAIALTLLSPGRGLINEQFKSLDMEPIQFFGENFWFVVTLIFTDTWKEAGFMAIIFITALLSIDPSLYEAAAVDGANKWQKILNISLPGIAPTLILVFILWIASIMNAGFEQIYIFYNPSVMEYSDIIDTWVYRNGIERFQFSLATAAGLFKSVVGLIIITISNALAKKWAGQGLW